MQTNDCEIEGNKVLKCDKTRKFPIALVEITNREWDELGLYAVVQNCGFNPSEGFNELDYQLFDNLPDASIAYDVKVLANR